MFDKLWLKEITSLRVCFEWITNLKKTLMPLLPLKARSRPKTDRLRNTGALRNTELWIYYSRFISFISLHFSAAGLPPEAAAERPDGQGGQHCSAGERDEEQQPGGRQTQAGRVCSSYRYHSCRCIVPVSGSSH